MKSTSLIPMLAVQKAHEFFEEIFFFFFNNRLFWKKCWNPSDILVWKEQTSDEAVLQTFLLIHLTIGTKTFNRGEISNGQQCYVCDACKITQFFLLKKSEALKMVMNQKGLYFLMAVKKNTCLRISAIKAFIRARTTWSRLSSSYRCWLIAAWSLWTGE